MGGGKKVMTGILLGVLWGAFGETKGADIVSYAIVQEDATLKVKGRTIRLFGIYIPPTDRTCLRFLRPTPCGSRAAMALELKIQGFVHCEEKERYADGSISAICWVGRSTFDEGEDLSAYLIREGWAVALPDAPFEYHVLEKIARRRSLGVWGFPVDRFRRSD